VTVPRSGGGSRSSSFRVVGTTSFPPDFGGAGLGTGAVFTIEGLLEAQCPPGPTRSACEAETLNASNGVLLIRGVPGPAGQAAVAAEARANPSLVNYPKTPADLVNFGEAVNFPLILGLVLILFGAATLLHTLVVSVGRRRTEVGLLKALGFVRYQVALAVAWQATTVALVGIVVGVPLGIALGQAVWRAFAGDLGVEAIPVVLGWAIAALALGALLVANLLAVGPAWLASRSRPATLLRAQ